MPPIPAYSCRPRRLAPLPTERPTEIEGNAKLLANAGGDPPRGVGGHGHRADLEKAGALSVPFIAMVAPPVAMTRAFRPQARARRYGYRRAHDVERSGAPGNAADGGLCLAVATRIPGSIPNEMARGLAPGSSQIRIGTCLGRDRRRCQDRPRSRQSSARRVRCGLPHGTPALRRPRALQHVLVIGAIGVLLSCSA